MTLVPFSAFELIYINKSIDNHTLSFTASVLDLSKRALEETFQCFCDIPNVADKSIAFRS